MNPYTVEFHVNIDIPDWLRNLTSFVPPTYRIYADNELMMERTYDYYKDRQYLIETLNLNLDPGIHTIKLEQTNSEISDVKLRIENLTANGSNTSLTSIQNTSISFRSR